MKPDWNTGVDFHIVFLPRSGSHMLVNALNSHPEIDCTHSDQGHHGNGRIKGHAQCVIDATVTKAIVLTRNSKDRTDSFFTNLAETIGDNHAYEPVTVQRISAAKAENRYKNQEIKNQRFFEKAEKIENALILNYSELTGDHDIREIPEKYSYMICDFIGVERKILKTQLHKPKVIGVK